MTTDSFEYIGEELDVFSLALNWKDYWASKIKPYLGDRVLEVGAGIGGTTRQLITDQREQWVALEPDQRLLNKLQATQSTYPTWCEFRLGTINDLSSDEVFDSVIYIDVLEHIEEDQQELHHASQHLAPNGHLIVLSPAYPYLFNEFDAAIGHYRRYTRQSLLALKPETLVLRDSFYLDSVGLLTSLVNKWFLHSPKPTASQIKFWDKTIIPISKVIDPLHRYSAGRSIIVIWQKPK